MGNLPKNRYYGALKSELKTTAAWGAAFAGFGSFSGFLIKWGQNTGRTYGNWKKEATQIYSQTIVNPGEIPLENLTTGAEALTGLAGRIPSEEISTELNELKAILDDAEEHYNDIGYWQPVHEAFTSQTELVSNAFEDAVENGSFTQYLGGAYGSIIAFLLLGTFLAKLGGTCMTAAMYSAESKRLKKVTEK